MNKIHDKASKFLNEVQRKKINFGNKVDRTDSARDAAKTDTRTHITEFISNNCCYCHKVFIDPKSLLKHILRRHPEDLISLHRKCARPESNNNCSDLKNVLDIIQKEFSGLKKELQTIKEASVNEVADDNDGNVCRQRELSCTKQNFNEQHQSMKDATENGYRNDTPNISENKNEMEIKLVKDKVSDMESDIQSLQNKIIELDSVIKGGLLPKPEIHNLVASSEDKILRIQEAQLVELRNNLVKILHSMLSDQLQKYNREWKLQFSELKKDVLRIDHLIDIVRKQINSPEHLEAIERKLEKHIVHFLNLSSDSKQKTSKGKNSRLKYYSSVNKHIKEQHSKRMSRISKAENITKITKDAYEQKVKTSYRIPNELSLLIAEKMAHFGIPPGVARLSDAEYDEKIRLIHSNKDQLNKECQKFSDIYFQLNAYADQKVKEKIKKSRKLRFSEPMISERNFFQSSHKNFTNQTYPAVKLKEHETPVDIAIGSGDSFWDFKELQYRSKQQLESTSIKESENRSSIEGSSSSQIKNSKSLKGEYSPSSVPFHSDKEDCYSSSKGHLNQNYTEPESPKCLSSSSNLQDLLSSAPNKASSLGSFPSDTEKTIECASRKALEKSDFVSEDSIDQVGKTFIKYPRNLTEASKVNFEDDNGSYDSLSSWESEERPS